MNATTQHAGNRPESPLRAITAPLRALYRACGGCMRHGKPGGNGQRPTPRPPTCIDSIAPRKNLDGFAFSEVSRYSRSAWTEIVDSGALGLAIRRSPKIL